MGGSGALSTGAGEADGWVTTGAASWDATTDGCAEARVFACASTAYRGRMGAAGS
jgi:hypothetical protein